MGDEHKVEPPALKNVKEKTIKTVECVKLCMYYESCTVRNGSVVRFSPECIQRYMAPNFPKSGQVIIVPESRIGDVDAEENSSYGSGRSDEGW